MFYINTMETTKIIPTENFQKKRIKKLKKIITQKASKTKKIAREEKSDKKAIRPTGYN